MALGKLFVCWWLWVLTQAFMAEAMGKSSRRIGRRCLDSVDPLIRSRQIVCDRLYMHVGYRSQTLRTTIFWILLCPGLVRSPRHGPYQKLLLDCIFSKTSQRTYCNLVSFRSAEVRWTIIFSQDWFEMSVLRHRLHNQRCQTLHMRVDQSEVPKRINFINLTVSACIQDAYLTMYIGFLLEN